MIDHITLGIRDFDQSTAFYDLVLRHLSLTRLVTLDPEETEGVQVCAYGRAQPFFWLSEERPVSGLVHIAFGADTRAAVDAFHAAALAAGGTCNGPPGLRAHDHDNDYAAYVRDPDGHNIEAVCHGEA